MVLPAAGERKNCILVAGIGDFVREINCFRLEYAQNFPPAAAFLISLIPTNFVKNLLFPLIFMDTPPPRGGVHVFSNQIYANN